MERTDNEDGCWGVWVGTIRKKHRKSANMGTMVEELG